MIGKNRKCKKYHHHKEMEIHIGKKLKNIRNYLHMTQQDLAKGICTQSMISLIEKDTEIYPSAHLLYLLSKRLGVSIDGHASFQKRSSLLEDPDSLYSHSSFAKNH